MKGMVAWFARNSVAANLLMFALVLGGIAQSFVIKMELFPEFSLDTISVQVVYPGAAPEEIVFTAGASEANNLAIKGAARSLARAVRRAIGLRGG